MRMSLKKKFSIIFILVMTGAIVLNFGINSLFLERFYLSQKLETLKNAYAFLDEKTKEEETTSQDFLTSLQNFCELHNISVLVIDTESMVEICAGTSNPQEMKIRLFNNFYISLFEKQGEWDDRRNDESAEGLIGRPAPPNMDSERENSESEKIYEENDQYVIRSANDRSSTNEYIEMWGSLQENKVFLIRTTKQALHESAKISNMFMSYTGMFFIIIGAIIIYIATNKMTKPLLQLTDISSAMRNLEFDTKYVSKKNVVTEIDTLGKNINSLSESLEETISELKTANNELQKDIEKKNEIDQMRRDFLSNVTHELKTPLALIQGYAEGLKDGIMDDSESMEFYCDVIVDETSKMNKMVKKLLTLNQLESGNDVVNMERFDIVTVISNLLENASLMIKQQEVEVRFLETEPIYVWGDEFKVEEVFTNYFSNAMNHVSGKKQIDIKLTKLEKKLRISVFNTGEPIPEDSIPHLWEQFYKVDKARTREYGGSGVGLSIVKAIMNSMNQQYGVRNFDDGVEFWFELETNC